MKPNLSRYAGQRVRFGAFLVLVLIIGLMVIAQSAGQSAGLWPGPALAEWFAYWRSSPLSVPLLMACFAALSFLAVPQFALIALCIAAFGPVTGLLLAWLTTVLCAWAGFYAGQYLGGDSLACLRGNRFERLAGFIARQGFWSALVVRLVPSGPFVLVNMAFGATRTPLIPFLLGTGVGILPKAGLIALAGSGFFGSGTTHGLAQGAAISLWLALALLGSQMGSQRNRADETGKNCALAS